MSQATRNERPEEGRRPLRPLVKAVRRQAHRGSIAARCGARLLGHRITGGRLFPGARFDAAQLSPLDRGLARIPGMTKREERKFLRWYGEKHFRGRGELVDLGSWMGSTVAPLAAGLAANPWLRGEAVVHAFDQFTWVEHYMADAVRDTDIAGRYREGDFFVDEFHRFTAPWKDLVQVHAGDLEEETWTGDGIEFLFVDAMKSWSLAAAITRTFFGSLMPGASLVVHQDFVHWCTPWIHLLMHRLRNQLEPRYAIPGTTSVVFECVAPVAGDRLDPSDLEDFSEAELDASFRYSASIVPRRSRPALEAARVMAWAHRGEL